MEINNGNFGITPAGSPELQNKTKSADFKIKMSLLEKCFFFFLFLFNPSTTKLYFYFC